MGKSKIFIASSDTAFCIAEKLRDELATEYCEAYLWKDAIRADAGQTRIEALERLAKKYDFAVIIFTKADMIVKQPLADLSGRDNCVFEAGLFMGVVGRNRCFFLSSVEKGDLPSDLEGILFFKFSEPGNLTDRDSCKRAIQSVSSDIKDTVQQAQEKNMRMGVATRPLSLDELLDREQLDPKGELLEDQVVVASLQPLVIKYESASRLWNNLNSNISYVYFFQASYDTADKIPQLLQLLLLAGIAKANEATSFQQRRELVKLNRENIMDALKDICTGNKLNVYFLQERVDIEYCIHNAISTRDAKLYLKRGDEFFEWSSQQAAYDFWTEMRQKKGAENPDPGESMFHGGREFELKEGPFLNNLAMGMRKYFPGFGDAVFKLCLGREYQTKQAATAGGAGPSGGA